MLIVAVIPPGREARLYATQSNVLEVLSDLAKAVERRENLLFTQRIINGFNDDALTLEQATVIIRSAENDRFSEEDNVKVVYASGPEYYRMRQIARYFSDLT